jgi:hypothetical protein
MIETLIMASSLAVLGYAFYISSRLFWSERKESGVRMLAYGAASVFIIVAFSLFALVLFSFATNIFSSEPFFNTLNVVLGVLLLSGSGLISALMKYQLSVASSESVPLPAGGRKAAIPGKGKAANAEAAGLAKEIETLRKELSEAHALNKLAVGRELRMVELKNKIKELETKGH